jgi:hypothetical protein
MGATLTRRGLAIRFEDMAITCAIKARQTWDNLEF